MRQLRKWGSFQHLSRHSSSAVKAKASHWDCGGLLPHHHPKQFAFKSMRQPSHCLPLERQTSLLTLPHFPLYAASTDWEQLRAASRSLFDHSHLDVEQPRLQVGHRLLSQSQVPGDHVQGLVSEEALVDRRHARLAADVPHAEHDRVLLSGSRREEQVKGGDFCQSHCFISGNSSQIDIKWQWCYFILPPSKN